MDPDQIGHIILSHVHLDITIEGEIKGVQECVLLKADISWVC